MKEDMTLNMLRVPVDMTANMLRVPVTDSDHVLGPDSAKVTLSLQGTEISSARHAVEQQYHALKILLKHFGHNVRLAFRHFPQREVHPHAELAAEAAEAAAAQHKFWQMHDLLLENQRHLKAKSLRQYAEKAELDLQRYDYEMAYHADLQRVQEHFRSGIETGIRATPTVFD